MRWERYIADDDNWAFSGSESIGYVAQLKRSGPLGPENSWIFMLDGLKAPPKVYSTKNGAKRALERAWAAWLWARGLVEAPTPTDTGDDTR